MNKFLFIFLFLILSVFIISAVEIDSTNSISGISINIPTIPINFSNENVNDSNFLQGFVPADFWQSFNSQTSLTGDKSGSFDLTNTGIFNLSNTFIMNGNGLVIGHAAQITIGNQLQELQELGTDAADSSIGLARFTTSSSGSAQLRFLKSGSSTIGGITIVTNGEDLGRIAFYGDDGNDYNTLVARISASVDDSSPAENAIGGQITLQTATTSGSITDAISINSLQHVGLGKDPSFRFDVTESSTNPVAHIQSTNDSSSLELLRLTGNSRASASGGDEAFFSFYLDDANSDSYEWGRFFWRANAVTPDTNRDGAFEWKIKRNDVFINALELTSNEAVFNQDANDTNFRVEGQTDSSLFVVDASSDCIGISISLCDTLFQVEGETHLGDDNDNTYFGTSKDATINYNGSDLLFDSRAVGTGDYFFQGGNVIFENFVGIQVPNPLNILSVAGSVMIGDGFTPDGSNDGDILNIIVGANSNGATNGISFEEADNGFSMQLGYDGSGSGAMNQLIFYNSSDLPIMRMFNNANVSIVSNFYVGGDIIATGNITSENLFVSEYIFSHTNETIPLTTVNVWENVTFGQENVDLKKGIGHVHDDNTNHTFTIKRDGIFFINYDLDVEDTSVGASNIDVAGRLIYANGTEIIGSVFEVEVTKQGVETELTHNFLARLLKDDVVVFQFIADDEDIQISTHGTFGDFPESATVIINKIANLDE